MALSDLSDRQAVLSALKEFDDLGQADFLTKYGFGPARQYFLLHGGSRYDSKAIAGAAHGYQFPDDGPLNHTSFSGGEDTVAKKLRSLGFEVAAGPRERRAERTFLFTWNPKKFKWDDLPNAVYEANVEGGHLGRWTCTATRKIRPGDRAFLMRLGKNPKGIVGSGVVVSKEPVEGPHWDKEKAEKGDTVHRVEILFDVLSDLPVIEEEALSSGALAEHNWFPQPPSTTIPKEIAKHLEQLWSDKTGTSFNPPAPEEISRPFLEGTKRSRLIRTSERNPEARSECLRLKGTRCSVCKILFKEQYGTIGEGFIHVHHVVPMSQIREEHKIDPEKDLCPVCPNCHAMLHKKAPPYTPAELRDIMNAHEGDREMTAEELTKEFIEIDRNPDSVVIRVRQISWGGRPHTPVSEWTTVMELPAASDSDRIDLAVTGILSDETYFGVCNECGERNPRGWMHAPGLCQECAVRNHGIVY